MRVFSQVGWASILTIAFTVSQFGSVTQAVDLVDVSSLPPDNGSNQQHDIKADLWYANAFTIENTTSGVFNTIFLALDPADQPPPPSISKANALDVNVYGSNPDGSVDYTPTGFKGLFSFNNSVSPYPGSVANAPYSFNGDPNQSISLPNDKYWIVVSTNQNLADKDKSVLVQKESDDK